MWVSNLSLATARPVWHQSCLAGICRLSVPPCISCLCRSLDARVVGLCLVMGRALVSCSINHPTDASDTLVVIRLGSVIPGSVPYPVTTTCVNGCNAQISVIVTDVDVGYADSLEIVPECEGREFRKEVVKKDSQRALWRNRRSERGFPFDENEG